LDPLLRIELSFLPLQETMHHLTRLTDPPILMIACNAQVADDVPVQTVREDAYQDPIREELDTYDRLNRLREFMAKDSLDY